jgi:hypothetical protein
MSVSVRKISHPEPQFLRIDPQTPSRTQTPLTWRQWNSRRTRRTSSTTKKTTTTYSKATRHSSSSLPAGSRVQVCIRCPSHQLETRHHSTIDCCSVPNSNSALRSPPRLPHHPAPRSRWCVTSAQTEHWRDQNYRKRCRTHLHRRRRACVLDGEWALRRQDLS